MHILYIYMSACAFLCGCADVCLFATSASDGERDRRREKHSQPHWHPDRERQRSWAEIARLSKREMREKERNKDNLNKYRRKKTIPLQPTHRPTKKDRFPSAIQLPESSTARRNSGPRATCQNRPVEENRWWLIANYWWQMEPRRNPRRDPLLSAKTVSAWRSFSPVEPLRE